MLRHVFFMQSRMYRYARPQSDQQSLALQQNRHVSQRTHSPAILCSFCSQLDAAR